jgi:hypothetical protein
VGRLFAKVLRNSYDYHAYYTYNAYICLLVPQAASGQPHLDREEGAVHNIQPH